MVATYPNGYSGSPQGMGDMRTLEAVAARKTVSRLHPEFRRRVFAFMQAAYAAHIPLGIGTGWRIQPTRGGLFVTPGNSYHEGFMPDGRSKPDGVHDINALACDMVPEPTFRGTWFNDNIRRFDLRHMCHYKGECWHIQPVEIPASRNFATRSPGLHNWNDGKPPIEYNPYLDKWGLFPLNPNKPALVVGTGYAPATFPLRSTVLYFAQVCHFKAKQKMDLPSLDPGVFTEACRTAVRNINAHFNLDGHNRALAVEAFQGFCGFETWKLIDHLASNRVKWV